MVLDICVFRFIANTSLIPCCWTRKEYNESKCFYECF